MFRIALKSILGRKARLVLTSLAVIIGTAFLAGTSVFSATLDRTFNNLFEDVFKNVDAYVRSSQVIEGEFGSEERQRIPVTLVQEVAKVPGVADALGVPADGTSDGSRAVKAIRQILKDLNFPVLRDVGVVEEELETLTDLALADFFITQAPTPWSRDEVLHAFEQAYALTSR